MPQRPTVTNLQKFMAGMKKPGHAAFVAAYLTNGGNKAAAYRTATGRPNMDHQRSAMMGGKWSRKEEIAIAIRQYMATYGASVENVAARVGSMVLSQDAWVADRGVTHARAILGLDAPTESHHVVDKREVRLEARVALDDLDRLLRDTSPAAAPTAAAPPVSAAATIDTTFTDVDTQVTADTQSIPTDTHNTNTTTSE